MMCEGEQPREGWTNIVRWWVLGRCTVWGRERGLPGERRHWISQLWDTEEEKILSCSDFHFIEAVNGLDEAHPHGGALAFLSLPIQMLISPRNTLSDVPRIKLNKASGIPVVQSGPHIQLVLTPHWLVTVLGSSSGHFSLFTEGLGTWFILFSGEM